MSKLIILTAAEAAHADFPWPDVYFTPWYGRAVEWSDASTWHVAVWPNGPILYPFMKRRIDPVISPEPAFDIASPYGYSGTWAPEDTPLSEWQRFRAELRGQLREQHVVSEFQRLGAMVHGRQRLLEADPELVGIHHNNTVSIDVTRTYEQCWEAAEGRARTKTRKAAKLGFTWSGRTANPADVAPGSLFRTMYEETMRRVDADPYYLFPDGYYECLQQLPGRGLGFLEVRDGDGNPAAAGLFMMWEPYMHLHLVGSLPQAMREGAGNLVYDGLIRHGCQLPQFRKMHVGGGMAKDDRLFYFKRGFGGEAIEYWIAKSIIDRDRYRALTEARAQLLNSTPEQLVDIGFFPAYRAGVKKTAAA